MCSVDADADVIDEYKKTIVRAIGSEVVASVFGYIDMRKIGVGYLILRAVAILTTKVICSGD